MSNNIIKINEHMQGQYTGNYVPIDPIQSSLHVVALLNNYDRRMKNRKKSKINPYKEKIYMKSSNGKYIEIPESVQKTAISTWLKTRKNVQQELQELQELNEDGDTDKDNYIDNSYIDEICGKNNMIDLMFQLTLCVIISFAVIYSFRLLKYKKL